MNYYSEAAGWGILVWIICIGAAVGLAFIPATIARNKGYSYGGFWALGFFFFLIGLIVALCLPDKTVPPPYQQYGQPYQQPYQPYGQPYQQPYQPQPAQAVCPNCNDNIPADSAFCPKCGTKIK